MTDAQTAALHYGLIGFCAVWAVALIPQLITHYARWGKADLNRVASMSLVTLYACLTAAVVLLPLPKPTDAELESGVQLVPLQWVADIGAELNGHGFSAVHALTSAPFQQVAMNVVLFVPLGAFLRQRGKLSLPRCIAVGFLVSLLIEITQLTANFGVAEKQYRVFDVDDLLTNTAGSALGCIAAALAAAIFATRKVAKVTVLAEPTAPAPAGRPHQARPSAPRVVAPNDGSPDAPRKQPSPQRT